MKIKNIAAICKKKQMIVLLDGKDEEQWIGDGNAIYPLLGMPYMCEPNIYALFDIPEKQQDKFTFRCGKLPESMSYEDVIPCENLLERDGIAIQNDGRTLQSLKTQNGIAFYDTKYLSPLADVSDALEIYERINTDGKIYFALKIGMMLMGIVMPYDLINQKFVEKIEDLTKQCRAALLIKKDSEEA